jgi:hypothetical protein
VSPVLWFVLCFHLSCVICFQELKNKWRSAEELRKTDNGHREKNSWKQKQELDGYYEPKCNIQKGKEHTCNLICISASKKYVHVGLWWISLH